MWETIIKWLNVNKAMSIALLVIGAGVGWTFNAHLSHLNDAATMAQQISALEARANGAFAADAWLREEVQQIQATQADYNAKIADLIARMRTAEGEINRLRDRE